jgi:hypothetical protein
MNPKGRRECRNGADLLRSAPFPIFRHMRAPYATSGPVSHETSRAPFSLQSIAGALDSLAVEMELREDHRALLQECMQEATSSVIAQENNNAPPVWD